MDKLREAVSAIKKVARKLDGLERKQEDWVDRNRQEEIIKENAKEFLKYREAEK
jgi:hypothetical protein